MPPLADVLAQYVEKLERFDRVVLRLMRHHRKGTGKVRKQIVDPHDTEIAFVAQATTRLAASGVQPFLLINNRYEGSVPMTIERIREQIRLLQ